MPNHLLVLLVPLLPLAVFLLLGLFGRTYLSAAAPAMGTIALLAAAVLAMFTAISYFGTSGGKRYLPTCACF